MNKEKRSKVQEWLRHNHEGFIPVPNTPLLPSHLVTYYLGDFSTSFRQLMFLPEKEAEKLYDEAMKK